MNNIEEWKKQRIDFYSNSSALNFIHNFLDVKKGVRCIAGHDEDMYKVSPPKKPRYRIWETNKCRAITIPDHITGKNTALKNHWCNHYLMYTFDKKILEWNDTIRSKTMYTDNMIGITPVLELDSPDDPNSDKAGRLTFFDHIEEFNYVIKKLDNIITNEGFDYNILFSGNGIHIIMEGYYGNKLTEVKTNFENFIDYLKEKEGLGNNNEVHVDNSKAPWNDYFKLPFTFHDSKRNRMSIPLSKEDLDKEWIDKVSNVDNIMNNYNLIDEIIQKSNWRKIW